LKIEICCFPG